MEDILSKTSSYEYLEKSIEDPLKLNVAIKIIKGFFYDVTF